MLLAFVSVTGFNYLLILTRDPDNRRHHHWPRVCRFNYLLILTVAATVAATWDFAARVFQLSFDFDGYLLRKEC